ncbi:MAG: hypothetical protein MI702_14055, partial [Chlorobiales bacterium]|nr:hypothetical protein [Chlorobiales bacterium]
RTQDEAGRRGNVPHPRNQFPVERRISAIPWLRATAEQFGEEALGLTEALRRDHHSRAYREW